ncbi:hypothetical protein VIBHAR_05429 [Vibrio campbellii ATCC BAA-1116]|uniref:Uncharacterized protein n=1 Tax=Vibrio campbellii (strain ATCC BAA-1116) TaxID=2902295 RepID=A7N3T3_VIBC1|nr:hypothetical protein VIBHAR_05429 [Vibrio campbellii ATCC BAA-1116]
MRFKGLTTLSKPSIFSARQSFSSSPSSPSGKPFLSNQSRYSSGRSIRTRPAYLPNGICIRASLIRFSFSNIYYGICWDKSWLRVTPKRSTHQLIASLASSKESIMVEKSLFPA